MDDFFDHDEDKDGLNELLERFEQMLKDGKHFFFDTEEYEDLVEHYIQHNDLKLANRALNMGMEQYPGSTVLLIRQAQLLISSNKAEKALKVLARVENIDPTNSELYITKGAIYSKLQRYDEAIREYNKAINEHEDLATIYTSIAYEYENLNNYDRAIEYLKRVLEIEPLNEAVFHELAFCYEISHQFEASITYFNEYLDKYPYSHYAWFNLGIAYNEIGLYEKAVDAYDFCIAINPNLSWAYYNKATTLGNMGFYKLAVETYKDTFAFEKPEAITYYFIGECYEKMEDYHSAIEYFRKATTMDKDIADAWIGMGVAYEELDDIKSALRFVKKGLSLDPQNPEYLATLAIVQQHAGLYEEAAESFANAAKYGPDDNNIWLDFSAMYAELDEYKTAIRVLDMGISVQPENILLQLRKIAYLYLQGKPKDAIAHLHYVSTLGDVDFENLFEYAPFLKNDITIAEIINDLK